MKKLFFTCLILLSSAVVFADEGMWMLHLLKQQRYPEMKKLGLKLDDYDIYNPHGSSLKDAVVQFGGGCTGEVISPQGLVLTNHHCGYGQIQNHSTLEKNYLDDGFWAAVQAEELPNPGLTVTFIEKIDDVTEYVKNCLSRDKNMDKEGVLYLSPAYLKKIAEEKVGTEFLKNNFGTGVEIKPFFEGNQYIMFTTKKYYDVRLVGAPPSAIGKFGADTDNWMWPRHTGDFALFRIYADKHGNPASYSTENVPLRPKRWLEISIRGVDENDFAMILGFPGTTNKYYTSWEVAERRDIDNAVRINMREVRQKAMLEEMLKDPQVKIQYASKYSGSTNGYKSAIGSNWAIDNRNFEQVKKEKQMKLLNWAEKNEKPEYRKALDSIREIVSSRSNLRFRERMLNEAIMRGIEFAQISTRNVDSLIAALQNNLTAKADSFALLLEADYRKFANKNYNANVDKKVSKALLAEYVRLVPREAQPAILEDIHTRFGGDVALFVDSVFRHSLFANNDNFERFLKDGRNAAVLQKDPMFNFVKSVSNEYASLENKLKARNNDFVKARRKYLEGILEMEGALEHSPDANLTLRLAYGKVKGYSPRDAVYYRHRTTLDGVMEKEDPENWEFVVPEKLKALYRARDFAPYALADGKMPVAFSADTHTTGGNSGSPVLNDEGRLIGINFDRNWEGVGGDIQYLPDYQRSIIVDIRYVLFVIDKYAGAKRLIEEMDIR